MFRLAVGTTADIISQHREIIRDNQIIFLICPRIARHKARLMMPPPSVITIKPLIESVFRSALRCSIFFRCTGFCNSA